ncbi:hypothetical protein [Clostridium sp. LP20]|uniref:hypothetical protein n=1 Tax=Clostridium sp. LP20 TaxID=3418665 RepID=UPI003EE4702A
MKKIMIISFIIFGLIFFYGCSIDYVGHPKLTVIGDNFTIDATINGGNWFPKSQGGDSFDLGDWDIERAREITSENVEASSTLDLILSYKKDIDSFKVYTIEGTNGFDQKQTEVECEEYKIKLPSESGEYIYAVKTKWDDTHSVNYLFKVNIK